MDGWQEASSRELAPRSEAQFITPGFGPGFVAVTSLFFVWAVAGNLNDILVRQFQKALALDRAQAGLIQFVFYAGYFVMALPAGVMMRRFGYRAGILAGLVLYATGAILFWPAAEAGKYAPFLGALFVLASGAAFLETAANPYVVAFGDPARASQRLNLAQAFNGFGAVIAPVVGGAFIFSGVEHDGGTLAAMSPARLAAYRLAEARAVQIPYLALAVVVSVLAVVIALVRLPRIEAQSSDRPVPIRELLGNRGLSAAVVAQFFYVGAQVCVWSFFVDFVKDSLPSTSERGAALMLSVSLGLFMAGRFLGAALLQRITASRLLMVFATVDVALCATSALSKGWLAVVSLGLTSFFMSVMFPTIFALGIRDLGRSASIGSSLLIMAVIGGAVMPPLMGWISVHAGGLHSGMLLPLVCFGMVARFALAADSRTPSEDMLV